MLVRHLSCVSRAQSLSGALGTAATFGTDALRKSGIHSRVEKPIFSNEVMKALLGQVFSEPLSKHGNSN